MCGSFSRFDQFQDIETRWNYTKCMGERLLEQRPALEMYCARFQPKLNLDEEEWELLARLIKLLSPIDSASREMCKDSSPISVQLPIAKILSRNLSEMDGEGLYDVKECMLRLLNEKFFRLEFEGCLLFSVKIKDTNFLVSENFSLTKKYL